MKKQGRFLLQADKNTKVVCAIYTLLLSQAIVAGKQVHYIEMRNNFYENYITLGKTSVLIGCALAVLLYPFILFLLVQIGKMKLLSNTKAFSKKGNRNFFFIAWAIIFIAWIPYLLSYYPGGIVGDGAHTLEMALQEGIPSHDHWVVLYIVVLKFFLWLGSLFSTDMNVGVFLYAITECILFSSVCAAVAVKLKQKQIHSVFAWASVAMYAFSGFFASYSMSLWKDTLFSAAIVLIVLEMWDIVDSQVYSICTCIRYGLLSLFVCFWRNNGLYVIVLCVLGLSLLYWRRGKKIIITGLLVIVVTIIIRGPVYDKLGIAKDSLTESFSIPIQQLAATINSGAELSQQQQEILFSIISEGDWTAKYCPTLSDDLKNSINLTYLETHVIDFLHVWVQLLIPNIGTYVRAYLMQTLGFWQPGVYIGNYYDYWIGIQDIFQRGWESKDLIHMITGSSIKDFLESRMEFISSGTMVWIMLFSLTAVCSQKANRRERLVVLMPLVASWLIIMVATPIAYAYRYIVMLPIAFPIICAIPFWHKDTM